LEVGRQKLEGKGQKPKIVGMNVAVNLEPVREAAGSRFERIRLFLSEVRNELKRVTWPSQAEVYATTVVVILVSVFFGVYLFLLDIGIDRLVTWLMRSFGAA
jgi:preprotein translocase subunit SecE